MSISVRQIDSAAGGYGGAGLSGSAFHTFFETPYGFPPVVAGDALVLMFCTDKADTRVTSITDNYGNVWTQIPGAQVSEISSGSSERSVDVWRADNVPEVPPYNPSLDVVLLGITVNFSGSAVHASGVMIIDVAGINGGSASAVVASSDSTIFSALTGPSLDGGSEALFFTGGGCALFGSETALVDSPFTFGSSPTGDFDHMNFTPFGSAYCVSSGTKAATFRPASGSLNVPYALSAVVIQAGSGGGGTPLSLDTSVLPNAHIGVPYSVTLSASGGTGPYTWAITGGSLPRGLSLDASTGIISGIPATDGGGNFSVTIQVTDSAAGTASKTFAFDSIAYLVGSWSAYQNVTNPAVKKPSGPRYISVGWKDR